MLMSSGTPWNLIAKYQQTNVIKQLDNKIASSAYLSINFIFLNTFLYLLEKTQSFQSAFFYFQIKIWKHGHADKTLRFISLP